MRRNRRGKRETIRDSLKEAIISKLKQSDNSIKEPIYGDVQDIRISCDGWYLEIDLSGLTTEGIYNLDQLSTNQPIDLAIQLEVTSSGFDDSGSPSELKRSVQGTNFKRQVYPNDALADETDLSGAVTVRISLSEWIYSTDTVELVVMEDGAYGTSSVSRYLPITNNSTEVHQKVVGNWTLPSFSLVGTSMELRCVAFHRSAQDGKPVRAVKFTVDDEHGNSASTIVTDATIDSYQGLDALPIVEYIGTVDTTTLTDGDTLTANFVAYPWYGEALDTSDGANVMPTPLYAPQYYVLDKADTYGRSVAVVSPSGNDTTGVVVDHSVFDELNPPSAFATIGGASDAIASFNNTNHGRNNTGGSVVYLREGTYQWTGSGSDYVNDVWLTVEGFPNDIKDNIIIGTANTNKDIANKVKVSGVNVTNTTTICFDYIDYLWIHDTIFDPTGAATIYRDTLSYFTNNELHGVKEYNPYSTTMSPRALFRGNTFTDDGGDIVSYTVVGNYAKSEIGPYESSMAAPFADNMVIAYNFVTRVIDGGIIRSMVIGGESGSFVHGLAIVQNVFEKTVEGSVPLIQIAADQSEGDQSNVIMWHNNIVGQRANLAYNDYNLNDVGPAYRKHWSIKHNIHDDLNIVTDTDLHGGTPNSSRYGNHAIYHGTGVAGNLDCSRVGAGTAYRPKYQGVYGIDQGLIDPLYIDDAGSAGTGLGNGDYSLQPTSPAKGIIPQGEALLPYDLNGYTRTNSGGGDIGAMLGGDE